MEQLVKLDKYNVILFQVHLWLKRKISKKHWRFKPEYMGKETILGEIGTHAYNLATFVTLEKPLRVSANLRVLTYGRQTYDDGQLVFEYSNGRLGVCGYLL